MRAGQVVTFGLLALTLSALCGAQGLGDAAARERARRAKEAGTKKEAPRTWSDADLAAGRPAGGASDKAEAGTRSASAGVAPTPANADEPTSSAGDRQAIEQPYVDAAAGARARLDQLRARIKELEEKLNPMSLSFIYGPRGSNSATEEAQARAELTDSQVRLPQAEQAVEAAERTLQDVRAGRRPTSQR